MPKLDRPGSCLLGKWQLPKLSRHLASTCFFSGSAVPPPNSNNWAAGRSRRSAACGHFVRLCHFSHSKHRAQSVSSHKNPSLHCRRRRKPHCLQAPILAILAILHIPPHSNITLPYSARTRGAGPKCHAKKRGAGPTPRHTRGLYPGMRCTESHWMASRPLPGL